MKDSRSFASRNSVIGLYATIQIVAQKLSAASLNNSKTTAAQLLLLRHCCSQPRVLDVLERQRSPGRSSTVQLLSHTGELHGHGSNTDAQSSRPQQVAAAGCALAPFSIAQVLLSMLPPASQQGTASIQCWPSSEITGALVTQISPWLAARS